MSEKMWCRVRAGVIGRSRNTEAQKKASRINGAKGGRPRKSVKLSDSSGKTLQSV